MHLILKHPLLSRNVTLRQPRRGHGHRLGLYGAMFVLLIVLLGASPAFAADNTACTGIPQDKLSEVLGKMNAASAKILNVTSTPVEGLCEIAVQSPDGGVHVFYADRSVDYLLVGALVKAETMVDLTAQSAQQLKDRKRVDLSQISLKEALVLGDRNAAKKVVIFTDPECPYCTQLHETVKSIVAKRKDIVFYIKMFPLNFHKDAYWKAQSIVCKQSLALLEDSLAGKTIEKISCASKEVDESIQLAVSLGITGTPTFILPDGRLRSGAVPENEILDLIDGKI